MSFDLSCNTFNVRGIRNDLKRQTIFQHVRKLKGNFVLLQETHSKFEDEIKWKKEWDGNIYFSHGTLHSAGVAILVKPNSDCVINKVESDINGRYIFLNITIDDTKFLVLNLYGPNKDKEQILFYNSIISKLMEDYSNSNIVIGGDFNIYLNHILDKKGGTAQNRKAKEQVDKLMETMGLCDIWRYMHPDKRTFTWHQNDPFVMCRLDYFLISVDLVKYVKKCNVIEGRRSDHRIVNLKISKDKEVKKGPGFWKINNSLLNDRTYVQKIKQTIQSKALEYSVIDDSRVKWELIKFEIKVESIRYSKQKAKTQRKLERNLLERLEELDELICGDSNIEDDLLNEYCSIKKIMDQLSEQKTKGAIIRSRADWTEFGEKSSEYFFNLEKRNSGKKDINILKLDNGKITTDFKEIQKEQSKFYKKLFSSCQPNCNDPKYDKYFKNPNIQKLSEEDKLFCEGYLTTDECLTALKTMKKNKTPGTDGLSVEFYLFFWECIKDLLVCCMNKAQDMGELSVSQRQAIITLLLKAGKDPLYLNNWRPISLLNVDYKIVTKCLSLRIKMILPKLIHMDQTGFVFGRFIGENIRLIEDILEFTDINKIPGLLLLVDFSKAYDSIEWSYMLKVLNIYNFGPSLCSWVKLLYNNISSTVLNGGYTNGWIPLERGVRQGCPLSCVLFVLCVEILSQYVRDCKDIEGINVNGYEFKVNQFADDTTAILKNVASAKKVIDVLFEFSECSGLKINCEKTNAIWIGSNRYCKERPLGLHWSQGPLRLLGIHVGYNIQANNEHNFNEKLKKLEVCLNIWKQRNLTIYGKNLLCKSLGISQLIYSSTMSCMPGKIAKQCQQKISDFIWHGKPPKVKWETLIASLEKGGIKAPDMSIYNKALKLSWIPRFLDGLQNPWKVIPEFILQKVGGFRFLLKCNYDTALLNLSNLPSFYFDILYCWAELKCLYNNDITNNNNEQILWNNKYILIDKKSVFYKKWYDKGVIYVGDLKCPDGNILSFNQFIDKFSIDTSFLQYWGLITAIPDLWRKANLSNYKHQLIANQYVKFDEYTVDLCKVKCKEFYAIIINKLAKEASCLDAWQVKDGIEKSIIENNFITIYSKPRNPKLMELQYKILHRYISTNVYLQKIDIADNNVCSYCNSVDSIVHAFIECKHSSIFWKFIISMIKPGHKYHQITEDNQIYLFGCKEAPLNYLLLYAKRFMWQKRVSGENYISISSKLEFKNKWTFMLNTIKYIHERNNKATEFQQMWSFTL